MTLTRGERPDGRASRQADKKPSSAGANLRVLIVSEHASLRFGGEAALPLHYFRVLRASGVAVWLITHARTRDELEALFAADPHILYVEDTVLNRAMWRLGQRMPDRIGYFTVGFVSRFATQLAQRRIARGLIVREGIDVVHQPMPVSPREPSMMFGLGVPVVIGPMNGGMDYPPAFRRDRGFVERGMVALGRASAAWLNWLMPGKRRAAVLLVANSRTGVALPAGTGATVTELVENGVDLARWRMPPEAMPTPTSDNITRFVFLGRLVDWKAVDLLLEAFARAAPESPMSLLIIGEGTERAALERVAREMGLHDADTGAAQGRISFCGWLSQADCAVRLQVADCLVLPSLLECGGAVVLEAMAMAKPVIATAWGGPLDYLDESCGILVPPDDREALIDGFAAAMVRLAQAPGERHRLGRAGRLKVEREYDWDVKGARILGLYERVAGLGKPLSAHANDTTAAGPA